MKQILILKERVCVPGPLSQDIREKIIQKYEMGMHPKNIADHLLIAIRSVYRIIAQYKKHQTLETKFSNSGRHSVLTTRQIEQLKQSIAEHPDYTIQRRIDVLELPITESGLSRLLKRLGYTFKKNNPCEWTTKTRSTSKTSSMDGTSETI